MAAKSTLMKLKENEREVRRKLIIDAAINLFARKPFNQVSMRDIAAEAGISAASIYRYFNDRDELFVEAFFRKGREIGASLERHLKETRQVSLEVIGIAYVDYLLDNDDFFQMMTHFMLEGGINENYLETFNNAIDHYLLNNFDDIFNKIGVTGNVRLLSHTFFAYLNGIMITFRKYPGRSEQEIRRHIHRLATIMAGIYRQGT
ncbi:MAG: TetR/AcrR family transcriptional regulator [Bacillota bacterium]|jgi:AcrR family transcriptional regulator